MADNKYNLNKEPDDTEVKSVLDAIKKAKAKSADPVDTAAFDKQEQEAQELYNKRADRAEWLSLADRVGTALTRIGAASAGLKSGVDLSKIDYGKGYDQTAAQDRAATDYKMSAGQIGNKRKDAKDKQSFEQDSLDREAKALEPGYDFAKYQYGQKYDTYQQGLRDQELNKRRGMDDAKTELNARSREERDAARAKEAQERQLRQLSVSDLNQQLKSAQEDADATRQAAAILATAPDLSKKGAEKLMTNYPGVMAKAGITPEQMASIEERAVSPGKLWGTNPDPKLKQQLIQEELLKPKLERITNLRQALDSVLGGARAASAGQPAQEPAKLVTMRHKETGATRELSPEDAAKLPKDQFEQVK
jgi:hypothetical protein